MSRKKLFSLISIFLGASLAFSQIGMAQTSTQTYGGTTTHSGMTSDMKNLIGSKVVNRQGEDLGKVADMTVSPNDNTRYLIVSPDLPQMTDQYVALPYSLVSGQPSSGTVTVDLSKEKFAAAPRFESSQWPSRMSSNWATQSSQYFGVAPQFAQPSSGTTGAQVTTDAAILNDIHSRFAQDPSLQDSKIQVFSEAGNITLNGFVPDLQAENRAVNLASQVPGVKSVRDNLMVSGGQVYGVQSGQMQSGQVQSEQMQRGQMEGSKMSDRSKAVDRQFSQQSPYPYIGGGVAAPDPSWRTPVVGAEVVNTQGDRLGRVVDATVGPGAYGASTREADTNFIIVAPYLSELRGKLVAIPFSLADYAGSKPATPMRQITVDISRDQFAQAPTIDQYAWPMGVKSGWATDSYRYFGQTPYFKH